MASDNATDSKVVFCDFVKGSPGNSALAGCEDLLLDASKKLLHKGSNLVDLFTYGENQGCQEFRAHLADFLTQEYGDTVEGSSLMLTAGATHGLHMLATLLVPAPCPIFTEDPSYFYGFKLLRDDLQRNIIPVSCDDQGMQIDILEKLLVENKPKEDYTTESRPYWAAVYMIPVFHNPTGITYSKERCYQLVRLARKHGILLIAEDVYNLLHFSVDKHGPPRLISLDCESDPDYGGGHVVSNSSFSKILAPSLRIGWIESPPRVLVLLKSSNYASSGGSFNHFMSKMVCEIIKSGSLEQHVKRTRALYKLRMSVLCNTLKTHLPDGCSFNEPLGGFFIWLTLPKGCDASELLEFAKEKYHVTAIPGIKCSPTESFQNCIRLSISVNEEDTIRKGAEKLCQACQEFINSGGKN